MLYRRLVLICIITSFNAFAGWFSGPSKSDIKLVQLSHIPNPAGECVGIRIHNASKYPVHEVRFNVDGTIPGRSTIYQIRQDVVSDHILAPNQSQNVCVFPDPLFEQPTQPYIPSFKINSVLFQDGKEKELLYD